MKHFVLLCLSLLGLTVLSFAQQPGVSGRLKDSTENRNITNAVVALLKKDSSLVAYTRSGADGSFQLPNVPAGSYTLLITFPKFADYAETVTVPVTGLALGSLSLTPKSLLLKEVIVRSAGAIRIKGDTTEFTADSFKVREGATVEDLMKKLPGFTVNSKGEITTGGKRVDKVLVDGEEFFGDDPTMATQNLSAKAVDKVQVFDTKTEQQNLTGISTGNEGKTINIKLKEDQKKGSFGKINAGTNFDGLVDAKGLYNRFVSKKKLSAYATRTNLNTGSLNWEDRQKLGMENDMEYDEIGGFYYSFGGNDEFSDWSLRGLPTATTAGALFSNKWAADKNNVNLSYRYNRLDTRNIASNFTQSLSPVITYRTKFTNSAGQNEQHAVNGKYEWKLDSLTSFKFTTTGLYKQTGLNAHIENDFRNEQKELINNGTQDRMQDNTRLQVDNSLQYKQLFKKANRQWLTTLRFGITDDEQNGFNRANTRFYKGGILDSVSNIDQFRDFDGQSRTIGGKTTFSEPLGKKFTLVVDYAHNRNSSNSYRNTYNLSSNGKYESLDTRYSNNFDMVAISNSGLGVLKYTYKKIRAAAGMGVSDVGLHLTNLDTRSKQNFSYLNLTPQASINYAYKSQSNISFNYRGVPRMPTIAQLQPIRDNEDPLYIVEGNPNLKVAFTNTFSTFFNQYKMLTSRGIYVNASISLIDNAISTSNKLDVLTGQRVSKPINVDGNYNWWVWGQVSQINKPKGEKRFGRGFRLNGNGGRNINYLNDEKNVTDYTHLETGIDLDYTLDEHYSFEFRPKIGTDFSHNSSPSSNRRTQYFTYGANASAMYVFPWGIEFTTNADVNIQGRISANQPGLNIILWNAQLAKKVFKKKDGKIMLVANDLLNQNRGYNRSISSSFITEERYSRIGQYFLLKFEWSFNKMGGTTK